MDSYFTIPHINVHSLAAHFIDFKNHVLSKNYYYGH